MAQLSVFIIAICVRAVLWIVEELSGIGDEFHPDSSYYVSTARNLIANDFDGWASHATSNELYVVVAAALLEVADSVTTLRFTNLLMGAMIPVVCFRLLLEAQCTKRTCLVGALFVSFLPYQAHLSVHALKDIPFILTGVAATFYAVKYKVLRTLVLGAILVSLRTYLGVFIGVLLTASLLARSRVMVATWLMIMFGAAIVLFEDTSIFFLEHRENVREEIGGREFFSSTQILRPETPWALLIFVLTSPVRQLFSPSILDARSLTDLAFSTHISLYQVLFMITGLTLLTKRTTLRALAKVNPQGTRLVLICVVIYALSVSFIDLVTPALGPLVRYRELSFLLLSMACFVVLDYAFRSRRKVNVLRDVTHLPSSARTLFREHG